MSKVRFVFNTVAVLFFTLMVTTLAQAQATRTWVSGVGDDINPCSRTAPCKTFAGAISKTAAGGEISILDPAGYGAVNITKAITIDGGGITGSIIASLVNGIIVNAGANDTVRIRNISINGVGNGLNGIRYLAGKNLHVENVTIHGFTSNGIDVNLGANNGNLTVKDSTINNCGVAGVRVQTSTGTATASLDNVKLQACQFGLDAFSGHVTISNSVASQNTSIGIVAESTATINVERTVISNNPTGVSSFSGTAIIRLSNSALYNNGTGINVAAGTTVASFQNNQFAGNTTPGAANVFLSQQ
ncbi:MAG TPA: right-handed parallel beta-helix repeat-containing protein [Blastocatellia bacterium]|nr:right-handed parallel beta-helix repeat-containing protein [Blastocatellia bacterium]